MEQLCGSRQQLRLSPAEFDRLAAGSAGDALVRTLRSAQRSRTALIIKSLADADPALAPAALLLAQAHDRAPDAVDRVLAHPWLGVWAVDRVRGDAAGRPDYLPYAALAGATVAGLAYPPVPPVPCDGVIPVPGLGMWRGTAPAGPARWAGAGWLPVRVVRAAHRGSLLELAVDDVDPYRDCFGVPVAPRLAADRLAALEGRLADAWRLLVDHDPGQAAELAAGLTTLVPLADVGGGRQSITHADAFGAFAAHPDADPVDLAVTMVHEFQHSKLNALLGMVRLFGPDDNWYFAPWRRDRRPISGLIHGVYAFTAVAEVWHALRRHEELAARATVQFAEVRARVDRGVRELDGAPGLTAAGRWWTARLAERIAALMAVPVPAGVDRAARHALAVTERAWRARLP